MTCPCRLRSRWTRPAWRVWGCGVCRFTGLHPEYVGRGSYVWNGSTGDWFDPTQWTPQGVPGPSSEATIAAGAVSLNTARQVRTLHLSGGTLRGSGSLTVISLMDWSGGAMQDTGVTRLDATATLNISGAAAKSLLGGRILENLGLAKWSGGTSLLPRAPPSPTGSVAPSGSSPMPASPAQGHPCRPFTTKASGKMNATGTTALGVVLNNSGTVRLQSGIVACSAGFAPGGRFRAANRAGGPTPGTGFGQLQVSGDAALAGTLESA